MVPASSDDIRTTELIGGIEQRELVVVPYDPNWVGRFNAERRRIADALGPRARQIEHIGSTSVPDLAAKPIIDLLVTGEDVADVADETGYLPLLVGAGYLLRMRPSSTRSSRPASPT